MTIKLILYKLTGQVKGHHDKFALTNNFSTSSRSQTLDYPDLYARFPRPQLDQLDLCSIAAISSPDQISLRSDITQVEVGMIIYRSGTDRVKMFNPTKLDRYTKASRSTRYSARPIHDRFSTAWLINRYSNCFDM